MTQCSTCGAGAAKNAPADLDGKKARVLAQEKKWARPAILAGGAGFAALAGWMLYITFGSASPDGAPSAGSAHAGASLHAEHAVVKEENGEIRVPLADLSRNGTRFYAYSAGGKTVKFFLLRAPDGSVRAALDACNACYHAKLGYRSEGGSLVCNNCGLAFRPEDVGIVAGGCNPIPLKMTEDGRSVVLKARDLEAGAKYF